MSVIALPSIWQVSACRLTPSVNQRVSAAPFGGSEQAVDLLNDRWLMHVELTRNSYANAQAIEAFIGALRGQTNTANLWHFARPNIAGTLAGALTLSAAAAQGAASVSINATTGTTLKAGDLFNVATPTGGVLLLMCAADATSSAGVAAVTITNRLRVALSSGAAVSLVKPTATFRLQATSHVGYSPGIADVVSLDFAEAI
jgi:hypothetical protein